MIYFRIQAHGMPKAYPSEMIYINVLLHVHSMACPPVFYKDSAK